MDSAQFRSICSGFYLFLCCSVQEQSFSERQMPLPTDLLFPVPGQANQLGGGPMLAQISEELVLIYCTCSDSLAAQLFPYGVIFLLLIQIMPTVVSEHITSLNYLFSLTVKSRIATYL